MVNERSRNDQKKIGHDERTARNETVTVQERKNYCTILLYDYTLNLDLFSIMQLFHYLCNTNVLTRKNGDFYDF